MRSLNYLHRTLASYERDGIRAGDPDYVWNDAHSPTPRCKLGTTTVPLIEANHFIHDIYQSDDFNHCCFFSGNVRRYLYGEGFLCENWFELVELYEKWVGRVCRLEESAAYIDPSSGKTAWLPTKIAKENGWDHVLKGTSTFRDPQSGQTRKMSPDEAASRGWVGVNKGATLPNGSACFVDPETGLTHYLDVQIARELGWEHINRGVTAFKNPETGERRSMTAEEAKQLGWVGIGAGIPKKTKVCPHCGFEGDGGNLTRWHFDNCKQRPTDA